jgi:hypothetical protein
MKKPASGGGAGGERLALLDLLYGDTVLIDRAEVRQA